MPELLDTLAAELERPREITSQVVNHLVSTYGVIWEDIGAFLAGELPKLEDYEIDLILSPMFTPSLRDQSVFAELLGRGSIPKAQWPGLVQQLIARPTQAHLMTNGQTHPVGLRDVILERFVHRLRLDATISGELFRLLDRGSVEERPLWKAIARRAIWQDPRREQILITFLTGPGSNKAFELNDALELLKLAETYEPSDIGDLLARIPHWQQVLRREINDSAAAKPFFNERVQEMHGGGRDQRRHDNQRVTAKESELVFLDRLQQILRS